MLGKSKISVLHLEDDLDDSELVLTELGTLAIKIDYIRVDCEKDFTYQLENNQFDIILADYNLPTFDGISALRICSEKYPDIPFIIVSGTLGEEKAVQMLKYGASDYLLKLNLKRLATAVVQSLEQARLKNDKINTDLAPAHQTGKFMTIFNKLLSTGKVTAELELQKKDGSILPVDLNAVVLPGGLVYGSCRDISDRLKATKDLEAAALRWVSTFDAISDVVCIVSDDHRILAMNRAGIEKTGLAVEKIIGQKCYDCIHISDNPISNCPCNKVRESGESSSFEYEQDDKYYHLQIWPIPNDNGKFESFVHIIKDISQNKRTQKALAHLMLESHQLSEPNVQLVRAINGHEAVELCKSHNFDLILMDLRMPVMDGYSATEKIKEKYPHLPVIAQTAYVTDKENAKTRGCDDFLSKPFNKEEILSIIHKHLKIKTQ